MLMLTEIRASGSVSYDLYGDVGDLRQLAENLVASECAQIAAQVRHAAAAAEIAIEGKRMAGVSFKSGTAGVPDALIERPSALGSRWAARPKRWDQ